MLKNVDEEVVLGTIKALNQLLKGEEGALDIFMRHKGIHYLRDCSKDYK
jgi:hypothetical protein